jgi:hypothetical protein
MSSRNLGLLAFVASGLAFTAGCGSDDLPAYYLLDRLRVVAASVVGAAAEVSAGDAGVQVAFHISDAKGGGRSLTYSLESCVDPGVGSGASPTCAGNPTRTVITASGSFVPGTAATSYYGVLTTPAFNIPSAAVMYLDPGNGSPLPSYVQADGVNYLVILQIAASPGESVTAIKQVVVSTNPTKNQNPTFAAPAVLFGGVDSASYAFSSTPFSTFANAAVGSAENYNYQKADGTAVAKTEQLTVTWLVTSGEMHYSRTDPGFENKFTPATPLPAKTSFIMVLRDDRGGMSVTTVDK